MALLAVFLIFPMLLFAAVLSLPDWRWWARAATVAVLGFGWIAVSRFGAPRTNEAFVASTEAALLTIGGWIALVSLATRAGQLATGRRAAMGRGFPFTVAGAALLLAPVAYLLLSTAG